MVLLHQGNGKPKTNIIRTIQHRKRPWAYIWDLEAFKTYMPLFLETPAAVDSPEKTVFYGVL